MSRRTRQSSSNVLNPNLTALLDVVLQLITFFMMLVHFGTRLEGATKAVRLPLAPAALPGTELTFDRLAVAMNAQGQLLVKGQSLDDEAAERILAGGQGPSGGLETLGEGARLWTNCRPWLSFALIEPHLTAAVRRLSPAAQDKGFAHFSLVVLRSRPR